MRLQNLDYHCCCVTLASSFLYFSLSLSFSQPVFFVLLFILSHQQFNVSISLVFTPVSPSPPSLLSVSLPGRLSHVSAASPLPPRHSCWHARQPVLCQTAISPIEISCVLKSLSQICHLNWGGQEKPLGFRMGWCFDPPDSRGPLFDRQINRLCLYLGLRVTDHPDVTVSLSKGDQGGSEDGFVSSAGGQKASGGTSRLRGLV